MLSASPCNSCSLPTACSGNTKLPPFISANIFTSTLLLLLVCFSSGPFPKPAQHHPSLPSSSSVLLKSHPPNILISGYLYKLGQPSLKDEGSRQGESKLVLGSKWFPVQAAPWGAGTIFLGCRAGRVPPALLLLAAGMQGLMGPVLGSGAAAKDQGYKLRWETGRRWTDGRTESILNRSEVWSTCVCAGTTGLRRAGDFRRAMPKARLAVHRTHRQTRRSPCSSMPSSSSYVAMLSPSLRTQSERPR